MAISLSSPGSSLGADISSSEIVDGTIVGADLNDSVVNDLTTASIASGDYVAIADVSASNAKKKALVSDIITLSQAGMGAQEVQSTTTVSVASGDLVALADVSDSNNTKKGLVSDIVTLSQAAIGAQAPVALTTVSAASGDFLVLADVSDSNNAKKALVSDIVTLAGGIAAQDIQNLTTVTLASGDLLAIADVSDSNNSKKALTSDIGAAISPVWTVWAPSFGGFSAAPTVTAYYVQIGKLVCCSVTTDAAGTSNATNFTITLPVAAKRVAVSVGRGLDNSVAGVCEINTAAASTTATLYYGLLSGAWTGSGNKQANFTLVYEAN